MKCASPIEAAKPEAHGNPGIRLPMGLLGFEQVKEFALIANPGEEPFQWFEAKNNPSLAFVVIEPFQVVLDYRADIPQTDVEFLGISSPGDAQSFHIVAVHGPTRATVNLNRPIPVPGFRKVIPRQSLYRAIPCVPMSYEKRMDRTGTRQCNACARQLPDTRDVVERVVPQRLGSRFLIETVGLPKNNT